MEINDGGGNEKLKPSTRVKSGWEGQEYVFFYILGRSADVPALAKSKNISFETNMFRDSWGIMGSVSITVKGSEKSSDRVPSPGGFKW